MPMWYVPFFLLFSFLISLRYFLADDLIVCHEIYNVNRFHVFFHYSALFTIFFCLICVYFIAYFFIFMVFLFINKTYMKIFS